MEATQKAIYLYFALLSVILLSYVTSGQDDHSEPVVKTNLGKIRGLSLKSDHGRGYFAFRGIPFAKPPVKDLRFKSPQPIDKWDGILDATEDGPMCIQYDFILRQFTGDEDCLNLNVYSPKLNGALPVLFFIHGGAYSSGSGVSSIYGEQRFMDKEAVLVTINYRLGPFGFLSTGDEAAPGNFGMLDQVLALQWVKDNIAVFGGDPNRVTIFGESAGASSVTLHMLSPLSKGLFHGAIAESGTILGGWTLLDDLKTIQKNTVTLAEMLNCATDSNTKLIECLRKKAAVDIAVKVVMQTMAQLTRGGNFIVFAPVVDKVIRGDQAFLPDKPLALLTENRFNAVPTMTGLTKDEGILFLVFLSDIYNGIRGMRKKDTINMVTAYTGSHFTNAERTRRLTETVNEYTKTLDESNLKEKLAVMGDILSDPTIAYPADEFIEVLAKHKVPTFAYKLSYRGQHTTLEKLSRDQEVSKRDWQIVTHLDDLQYLFRCAYFVSSDLPEDDQKMADIILTLWTNFAKTGVPTLEGSTNNYAGFQWLPATTDHLNYLDLTLRPKMVDGHLCERHDTWKQIYGASSSKDEL